MPTWSASHSTSSAPTSARARATTGSAVPCVLASTSARNRAGESSIPAAAWKRDPGPGTIAVDIEVLLPRRWCGFDSTTSTSSPSWAARTAPARPPPAPAITRSTSVTRTSVPLRETAVDLAMCPDDTIRPGPLQDPARNPLTFTGIAPTLCSVKRDDWRVDGRDDGRHRGHRAGGGRAAALHRRPADARGDPGGPRAGPVEGGRAPDPAVAHGPRADRLRPGEPRVPARARRRSPRRPRPPRLR